MAFDDDDQQAILNELFAKEFEEENRQTREASVLLIDCSEVMLQRIPSKEEGRPPESCLSFIFQLLFDHFKMRLMSAYSDLFAVVLCGLELRDQADFHVLMPLDFVNASTCKRIGSFGL